MGYNRGERYNGSGYSDPTAYYALQAVERSERREQKKKPEPLRVYICSPYRGDTETNTVNALCYCRFAVEQNCFPIAPHCYLPQFMDDNKSAERELALSFGLRLLRGCRELWIFGDNISEGMRREIDLAKQRNIKIRQFTEKMKEVHPKC